MLHWRETQRRTKRVEFRTKWKTLERKISLQDILRPADWVVLNFDISFVFLLLFIGEKKTVATYYRGIDLTGEKPQLSENSKIKDIYIFHFRLCDQTGLNRTHTHAKKHSLLTYLPGINCIQRIWLHVHYRANTYIEVFTVDSSG